MTYVNGTLVLLMGLALAAGKHFKPYTGPVPLLWPLSAVVLFFLGYSLAINDRRKLPENEQRRLKGKGYIPGVTSSLSNRSARLFCTLMIWWLAGFLGWVLLHYHSQAPERAQ
jgi:hypothetical protein